jgi:hypothetical protein
MFKILPGESVNGCHVKDFRDGSKGKIINLLSLPSLQTDRFICLCRFGNTIASVDSANLERC